MPYYYPGKNMPVKIWLPWKRKVDGQGRLMSKCSQLNLGKVTKFGGYSFNGWEVTNLQSWRGLQKPPSLGLDRVLKGIYLFLNIYRSICATQFLWGVNTAC